MNPGEGDAQVEVERAAQFDEVAVEVVVVDRFADVGRDVENDRHGRREFFPRDGAPGLGLRAHGGEGFLERGFGRGFGRAVFVDAAKHVAKAPDGKAERKELGLREARNEREEEYEGARHFQGARLTEELLPDLRAHVFARVARARDEDARGNRDEKRGNLAHETVADRKHAVELQGVACGHPALRHPDDGAAHDVDERHDHAGDAVALDELHGAVHGAVHLALHLHVVAAALCLLHVDHARAQVGVDRHLLARHRVEGEAGADFGHAFRTLGDHEELHDREDQEDHGAHDEVAPRREFAEGEDDFTGVGLQEDQARRRDVEAYAKERREEEHGRKDRELERRLHVHRHHQHEKREREVRADQRVDERRRQRNDHERDHDHDEDDHGDVAVPRDRGGQGSGFLKKGRHADS